MAGTAPSAKADWYCGPGWFLYYGRRVPYTYYYGPGINFWWEPTYHHHHHYGGRYYDYGGHDHDHHHGHGHGHGHGPGAQPQIEGPYTAFASSRSLNFWILPVEVLGSSTNTT